MAIRTRSRVASAGISRVHPRLQREPCLFASPEWRALLHKRAHALAQVARIEGRTTQLDQLTLDVLEKSVLRTQQLVYHTFVPRRGKRRVRGQLPRQYQRRALESGGRGD